MKKQLISTAIIIALTATQSVSAKQTPANPAVTAPEKHAIYEQPTIIGFSSGVIAGAIIAGPVGAVVAGTIGLLIGNAEEVNENHQITQKSLQNSQKELTIMTSTKQSLSHKLTLAEQQNTVLAQQLQLANNTLHIAENLEKLKLNVQFNVNSSELQNFYQEQVTHLALLIQHNPDLQIHLSGYADRNGEKNNNLALSKKRITAVKKLLVEHGISERSITTQALGESAPVIAQQSLQNDFYDRRVSIQLIQQPITNTSSPANSVSTLTAGN